MIFKPQTEMERQKSQTILVERRPTHMDTLIHAYNEGNKTRLCRDGGKKGV